MKFHACVFESVLEQAAAIQATAPEGFQLHIDFSMTGDTGGDRMPSLLEKLASFPVVGSFEDAHWLQ